MGHRAGTMSLCIPYQAIEPIMSKLSQQTWLSYHTKRSGESEFESNKLSRGLGATHVELRTTLAKTSITLGELMNLGIGDVLTTEKPTSGDVVVQVGARNKFTGALGQYRGKKAVRVRQVLRGNVEPVETDESAV
jgi:flagellar motor switch protein FliM